MSFDLSVWREETPITASVAGEKYRQFCDGMPNGETDPRVADFLTGLRARFPDLKDDLESSPWNSDPWVGSDHVILTAAWSRADEIEAVVKRLAAEHELVLYNPQEEIVRNPPVLLSLPGQTLSMCDGSALHKPAGAALREALHTLSPRNWFAILDVAEQVYVQVGLGPNAGLDEGVYSLEHRDGSPERHRRHVTTDLEAVIAAFEAVAANEPDWTERLTWEPLTF
ncbi:hypothetical protein [Spirillospora sp. CA-128828]|uniref:hypothetical protein n=1 Tax=Spirillospora sp. CA-128828 TaxID=3240033 RepID=UPI003D8EFE65